MKLAEIEREIAAEARRANRFRKILFAGYATVTVLLFGHLMLTHQLLTDLLDENRLAQMASQKITEEALPRIRPAVRALLEQEAPALAETALSGATRSLPGMRAAAQERLIGAVDGVLADAETRFQTGVTRALAEDPALVDGLLAAMQPGPSSDAQALAAIGVAADAMREAGAGIDEKLGRVETRFRQLLLSDPSSLTKSQLEKRRLLVLALASYKTAAEKGGL